MMAVRHAGLMPPELAVDVFEFAGLHFGMDDDAIAHVDRLPGGQGKRGVGELRIEGAASEGIDGQQAVIAHVPARGVMETLRRIEEGDAELFAVEHTTVIHPLGGFAPRLFR